jgi:hypothetical protein
MGVLQFRGNLFVPSLPRLEIAIGQPRLGPLNNRP